MFPAIFDLIDYDPAFRIIGRFRCGQFELDPTLRAATGVYFFVARYSDRVEVLRIGIAFGKQGLLGRFRLHNRWLAGLFKPHDAAEQAAWRLMLEGLNPEVEVWGWLTTNHTLGRNFERLFRTRFSTSLRLDRAARGSWMNRAMADWRSYQVPDATPLSHPARA